MPIFEYKGLTRDGKNTKGIIDAENLRAARVKLKKDGIFVVGINDKKKTETKNMTLMNYHIHFLLQPLNNWH